MMAEPNLTPIDFAALARHTGRPVWSAATVDLNLNLVSLGPGERIEPHTNSEVDVLIVAVTGEGYIEIGGRREALHAGQGMIVPRGHERALGTEGVPFAYLTCHRRRGGLWPGPLPQRD